MGGTGHGGFSASRIRCRWRTTPCGTCSSLRAKWSRRRRGAPGSDRANRHPGSLGLRHAQRRSPDTEGSSSRTGKARRQTTDSFLDASWRSEHTQTPVGRVLGPIRRRQRALRETRSTSTTAQSRAIPSLGAGTDAAHSRRSSTCRTIADRNAPLRRIKRTAGRRRPDEEASRSATTKCRSTATIPAAGNPVLLHGGRLGSGV